MDAAYRTYLEWNKANGDICDKGETDVKSTSIKTVDNVSDNSTTDHSSLDNANDVTAIIGSAMNGRQCNVNSDKFAPLDCRTEAVNNSPPPVPSQGKLQFDMNLLRCDKRELSPGYITKDYSNTCESDESDFENSP